MPWSRLRADATPGGSARTTPVPLRSLPDGRSQGSQGGGGDNTHTITLGDAWAGRVTSGAGTPDQNTYTDGRPVNVRGD